MKKISPTSIVKDTKGWAVKALNKATTLPSGSITGPANSYNPPRG
jgi:hypothetical protein